MSTTDPREDCVVQVKTTNAMDPKPVPFPTERLFMRPLVKRDFESCRMMLLDEETIMYAGLEGIVDEETAREWFDALEEWPTVGIFLKADGVDGEFVGTGGVYWVENSWPEVHYTLKKEHWGKGYASEFLKGLAAVWWALPRKEVEMVLDPIYLEPGEEGLVTEALCAHIRVENKKSKRVAEKVGFRRQGEIERVGKPHEVYRLGPPS
jgi:RimJ/RimL family protein N-acetyltransferase